MNKKTLLVLGTFWIFVVALICTGSVAAEGMYWGDSIGVIKPAIGVGIGALACGMYWGD